MRKLLILSFILVLLLTFVNCEPPLTRVEDFPEGYRIQEMYEPVIKLNDNHVYYFFVYNSSTGVIINNDTMNCTFYMENDIGELILENQTTFNEDSSYWYINLSESYFQNIGFYPYAVNCQNGFGAVLSGSFKVTYTGREFDEGQGITAFAVLFGALGLAFLFMMVGIKMSENPKYYAIALFFMVFSMILGVYSLNLGYAFTHDILQYESLTPVAQVIYTSFLWLIIGIVIITMALMLIAFIKELGKMSKTKKFGEGFNPVTNSYDF